jgi:hypothetical protein
MGRPAGSFKGAGGNDRRQAAPCRCGHSPLWGGKFFHRMLILTLASRARLATIYGVPRGSLLNLLWLGRKMLIFRDGFARALWISGNGPRKAPVGHEFRLVSAPWHRVEQKQNKPSRNGQ